MKSVTWDQLAKRATYHISALRRGESVEITSNGTVFARLTRMPALREDADRLAGDRPVATISSLLRDRLDRRQAIMDGERIVIGRGGRREAVIEGVGARTEGWILVEG